MVVVYNPTKIKTTYEKNEHRLNVIFIYILIYRWQKLICLCVMQILLSLGSTQF